MSNESIVEVDKSEEVAQGWQHALSNMVSINRLRNELLAIWDGILLATLT